MHVTEVFVEVGAQPVEIDDVAAIQVKTDIYLKLKTLFVEPLKHLFLKIYFLFHFNIM